MSERRKTERVSLSAPIIVTGAARGSDIDEVSDTIDVSSNGACLRVRREILPGTHLRLDILYSDRFAEVVVLDCRKDSDRWWRLHVKLLRPQPNFWNTAPRSEPGE